MVKAQEWLDKNYPKEERKNIKQLEISSLISSNWTSERKKDWEELEGSLKIENFENLESLDCSHNKLTSLTISNCPKLAEINCQNNSLTELDFTSLNPKTLRSITLYNNNLSARDLSCFSSFVNLENLWLGNNYHAYYSGQQENLDKSCYNRFHGSLEFLKDMSKLKILGIPATDIDSGLEYLSGSIENFNCDSHSDNRKIIAIEKTLLAYVEEGKVARNGLKKWKIANANLIEKAKSADKLDQQFQQLSTLLFPNQAYNFNQLKQEFAHLKYQELAPQVRGEKDKFEQLIANAKEKVGEGSFAPIIDLLLETQKQLIKNDDQLTQGQLIAYQTILENNLSKEEIKTLLAKQTELYQLEEHLASLQQNKEQVAQIQQNIPLRNN